jgi:hypothetical protein
MSITIEADVDDVLNQISTNDLLEEVERRGLQTPATGPLTDDEAHERLEAIHHLMRMKKSKEAYKLMYNYVRDVLGKAI